MAHPLLRHGFMLVLISMALFTQGALAQDTAKDAAARPAEVLELEIGVEYEAGGRPGAYKFKDAGKLKVLIDTTNRNRLRVEGRPMIRRSWDDKGEITGISKSYFRYLITPTSASSTNLKPPPSNDYVFLAKAADAAWANDIGILVGLPLHPELFESLQELSRSNLVLRFSPIIEKLHGPSLPIGTTVVKNPGDPTDFLRVTCEDDGKFSEVTAHSSDVNSQSFKLRPAGNSSGVIKTPWPSAYSYERVSGNDCSKTLFVVKSSQVRKEEPADFNPMLRRGTTLHDVGLDKSGVVREPRPLIKESRLPRVDDDGNVN
jgi:hypothetical protein